MAFEFQTFLQKQSKRRIIFNNQNSHSLSPKAEHLFSTAGHITNSAVCGITLVHWGHLYKTSLQDFAHSISKWEFRDLSSLVPDNTRRICSRWSGRDSIGKPPPRIKSVSSRVHVSRKDLQNSLFIR
jgi:hypothetical protein